MRTAMILLTVLLFTSAQSALASPAEWLQVSDKSTAWIEATANARKALAMLDPANPQTARYVPWLMKRAKLLNRVESFDWKTVTAVQLVEAAALDLAEGKTPLQRYAGQGVGISYWSEAMQRIEAVWVQVPPHYSPDKDYQVFMYYKCGGGIRNKEGVAQGGYRPTAEMCCKFDDTFHVWSSLSTQVKGRNGAVVELKEAMGALQQDFSINSNRVFVTGWSDGGFTSFWLASHYPHLLAGAVPYCANWQYGNIEEIGLFNVPVLVADGWGDQGYNSGNFTRFHALKNMGYDISCLFGQHGHSYQGYEDEAEMTQIMAWARKQRRNVNPRRVRYATWNLAWHQAYWFSIERMAQPALAAQIDAEVKVGNRVEVQAQNVAAFRLTLDSSLVDVARPLTVVTNGETVYQGAYQADLFVELTKADKSRPAKTPLSSGGIVAKLRSTSYDLNAERNIPTQPWMEVRPTKISPEQKALVDKWVPRNAVDDTQVTDADLNKFNLILYGGPDINRVAARFAADFPVQFGKQQFTLGHRVYDQPEHAVQFLYPNPLSPGRDMIIHACNDLSVAGSREFNRQFGPGAGEFRTGDVAVFGAKADTIPFGISFPGPAAKFSVLDAAWRENGEVLGQAAQRFGYPEILRLWADAMQEKAGVDAAVVLCYPTTWNRWNTHLSQGPISMADLASTAMLPEYAALCEVSGETLKRMCREAAATSVLSDAHDPAYRAGVTLALSEIRDDQSYRIALDYQGSMRYAYRVEPSKMPHLFAFDSPEEFLAAQSAQLPLKNLRYSDIEWTAAAVQYVRRHKEVSPRPECFDLTRYLLDPQVNQFGAYDWLHVSVPDATVHIALHHAGQPKMAPPRANSKAFVELMPREATQHLDLSTLSGKLPVAVEISTQMFAIHTSEEQDTFRLMPIEKAGNKVGRLALVQLKLVNQGNVGIEGLAVLGAPKVYRIDGDAWPGRKLKEHDPKSFVGFHELHGPRENPTSQKAELFVIEPEASIEPLRLPNAGFNLGLVGLKRELRLPAKSSVMVPLVLLQLDSRPG